MRSLLATSHDPTEDDELFKLTIPDLCPARRGGFSVFLGRGACGPDLCWVGGCRLAQGAACCGMCNVEVELESMDLPFPHGFFIGHFEIRFWSLCHQGLCTSLRNSADSMDLPFLQQGAPAQDLETYYLHSCSVSHRTSTHTNTQTH